MGQRRVSDFGTESSCDKHYGRKPNDELGDITMDEMSDREWNELAEAIVVWTGKGSLKYPTRSESRLAERFGQDAVAKLLPTIGKLVAVFYARDGQVGVSAVSGKVSAIARRGS
jgi:hypothetical protein